MKSDETSQRLYVGSFPGYEDSIVGTKSELEKLRGAIDLAIEKGEVAFNFDDDYEGIYCLSEQDFQKIKPSLWDEVKGWLWLASIAGIVFIAIKATLETIGWC